ncbi:AAA family ATPase [Fibrobacter sp. UWS1]|uniref:AAA family ATPase n=1 Tax=Fibrobacter sp. UWS1 TaxID=1896220 RepID=UPI000BB162CD
MEIENAKSDKIRYEKQKESFFGKVRIDFTDIFQTIKDFNNGDFIVAYYKALRVPSFEEVKVLEKPKLSISTNIQESSTNQFLKFLVDYKIQAALARNEGNFDDDDHIKKWFDEFKDCLRSIFDDSNLDLIFDYHKYSFSIQSLGKVFKFTELSAGYAAALDIVSDLMLKMQKKGSLTRAYEKPGIVIIDEPETHLHLSLQRQIMPILTKLFPHVQFIVATHSPFVLSSIENAIAFDLENKETVEDLTEYSYDSLAEGYFGVSLESGILATRLERLEELIKRTNLSSSESCELDRLIKNFDKMSEIASPLIKGRFMELKRSFLH